MTNPKSKKVFLFLTSLLLVLTGFLFLVNFALALTETEVGLNQVAKTIILPQQDIRLIVANIIRVVLGLIGVVSLIMVLYGGFTWMTSGGEEEKINQAKKTMINWAIGLAIILLALAIVTFIMRALGINLGVDLSNQNNKFGFGRGALGAGIIESHYPKRGALDVARDTLIIVTFKENMDDATLIAGTPNQYNQGGVIVYEGALNVDNVKIFANSEGIDKAWGFADPDNPNKDRAVTVSTINHRTYTFQPHDPLGSPTQKMYYSVRLGEGIKKQNGGDAFPSGPNNFYLWDFEVGIHLDIVPPQVVDVFPVAATTEYRNAIIQINFSEAVNPITILPANILVYKIGSPTPLTGTLTLSNEYRTVEFVSDVACGLNSCDEEIYCLPGPAQIKVIVKAATLVPDVDFSPEKPAKADASLDGVTDTAANSLNGNGEEGLDCDTDGLDCPRATPGHGQGDGHCDCSIGGSTNFIGPLTYKDNYVWQFMTNDDINNTPPVMEDYVPGTDYTERNNVSISDPVTALFDRRLMGSTLTSAGGNVTLTSDNPYVVDGQVVQVGGQDLKERDFLWFFVGFNLVGTGQAAKCQPYIEHAPLQPTLETLPAFMYSSQFTAGVKDVYQNCYKPTEGPGCHGYVAGDGYRSCCTSDTAYKSKGLCPQPLLNTWRPGQCGNGTCDETPSTCPRDCSFNCGNGVCASEYGENKDTCPADCVF